MIPLIYCNSFTDIFRYRHTNNYTEIAIGYCRLQSHCPRGYAGRRSKEEGEVEEEEEEEVTLPKMKGGKRRKGDGIEQTHVFI